METDSKVVTSFKNFLIEIGELSYFTARFFKELFNPPFEFKEFWRQCYNMGNRSLLLVSVTGFIIGLVFTLQSRPTLEEFGAVSWMPSMVSISIIREIGPIITALICAGRIGSGIGAELGSMKVTEQIDAMEVSGTNPFKYLVVTRVLAATLMLPILVLYAVKAGQEPDTADWLQQLKRALPGYMLPKALLPLPLLPKNANGKIDRKLLAEQYRDYFNGETL